MPAQTRRIGSLKLWSRLLTDICVPVLAGSWNQDGSGALFASDKAGDWRCGFWLAWRSAPSNYNLSVEI